MHNTWWPNEKLCLLNTLNTGLELIYEYLNTRI